MGKPGTGEETAGEDVFVFPATVAQHRFWLLDQIQPGNPALNVPLAARLTGRVDVELLERVVNEVAKRHEILRTSFRVIDGNLAQVIHSKKEIPLARFDLTPALESERETKLNDLILQEGKIAFALANGPLLRAGLIKLRDDEYILLLTMHHIGSDGWSNGVLIREVARLYNAFREDQSLPDLPLQYADFAVWQQDWLKTAAAAADREFWRTQLGGTLPHLNLPTDYPRKASRSNHSTIHTLLLPAQLTEAIKNYCNSENLTPFMVFLAVYAILLHRYSGQSEVTIGSPAANRNQPDLEDLIGLFSNPLLLRLKFSPGLTLRALMNQIKMLSLEVMDHQAYPFEKVVEEIQTDSTRSGLQWLRAYMVFQKAFMLPQRMGDVTLTPLRSISPGAMFDWMLGVLERAEGIRLQLEFNTDLFDQSTIDRILHQFQYLLETVVTGRELQIDKLPILTPQERQQLVLDWNKTQLELPTGGFVHVLFEERVRQTPHAPAFQKEGVETSYSELNLRANKLAHFLQGQGLQSGGYVGLAVSEDSVEFVTGFLAILKAGGCCVPLDLSNDVDVLLLERLVTNSRLEFLVTGENPAASLMPTERFRIIDLNKDANLIGNQPGHNPTGAMTGGQPACVLFSARSRNGPVISHDALLNSVLVARRELELASQDCVAFSLTEMLPALLSGAKLVCRAGTRQFNANDWWQWVKSQGVTVAALPTTGWHDLVKLLQQAGVEVSCRLRLMAIGGSLISPAALLAWQRIIAGRIRLVDRFLLAEAAGAIAFTDPMATGSAPGRVSIHRPAPNTRIYLLDNHLNPVPIGVPGNLYVGSGHLACGYLTSSTEMRPELVADPILTNAGGRLIKTGDTGRFLPGGGIELLGRTDVLTKTNGFRLELCEIRSILFQHPAVWDALLIPREISSAKNGLVVYWICHETNSVEPQELRAFLAERLPTYMVPDAFVPLAAWPMTADGRVDYKYLPSPDTLPAGPLMNIDSVSGRKEPCHVAPRNHLEHVLCKLWCDVLRLERVSITDDFFALGGHSLLAVRLISEINKHLKTKLSIPAFFQNRRIEQLALVLSGPQNGGSGGQLIPLRPGPANGALVFLNAGVGECRLADLLNEGRASFATAVPLSEESYWAAYRKLHNQMPSLEKLAAAHTSLIKSLPHLNSCILVGYSFSGLLAFEVAHQLQKEGKQVEMIFLLDSWAKSITWRQKLRVLNFERATKSLRFRANSARKRLFEKLKHVVNGRRVKSMPVETPNNGQRNTFPPQEEIPWEIFLTIFKNARENYRGRRLDCEAVLFRVQDIEVLNVHPTLGWSGLFKRRLEIVDCSGEHDNILKEPNLQILAGQFSSRIPKLRSNSQD